MNFSYKFLKKNFLIYFFNFLSIIFTYILIIISFDQLDMKNFYKFTGFVAILNIFMIPMSSISISLSRLDFKEYINQINKIFFFFLIVTFILILINFFSYDVLNLQDLLKLNKNDLYYLILTIFIYSIYTLNISKFLKDRRYEAYSLNSFLPFLIRVILIICILLFYKKINFNHILFVYILSFLYLTYPNFTFKKQYLKFWKNNFFLKKEFFNNFLSIIIISLVLNLDILLSRSIDIKVSNEYYIASLYGKVLILSSLFVMPYIYKLSLKSAAEFHKIIILNFLINLIILFFYFFYLQPIDKIFFPKLDVDRQLVMKICSFCMIFSISFNLSNRLIIKTAKHLFIKFLFLSLCLICVYLIKNFSVGDLISLFIIISIFFFIIDLLFYLKYFSIKLNLKYQRLKF